MNSNVSLYSATEDLNSISPCFTASTIDDTIYSTPIATEYSFAVESIGSDILLFAPLDLSNMLSAFEPMPAIVINPTPASAEAPINISFTATDSTCSIGGGPGQGAARCNPLYYTGTTANYFQ